MPGGQPQGQFRLLADGEPGDALAQTRRRVRGQVGQLLEQGQELALLVLTHGFRAARWLETRIANSLTLRDTADRCI